MASRCNPSTFHMVVTADTLAADIAKAALQIINRPTFTSFMVLEINTTLGLSRCLRHYESVLDVVSAWGKYQRNRLVVVPRGNNVYHRNVTEGHLGFPDRSLPPGFSFQLYLSSGYKNWKQCWVTLTESGNMFAADQPISQPTTDHLDLICHLSDHDIYIPRDRVKHDLKCPQRFCFGVKSQSRGINNRNDDVLVHFFSTDNEQLAHRFHELIVHWRSWYLINKDRDQTRGIEATRSNHKQTDTWKNRLSRSLLNWGETSLFLDVNNFSISERGSCDSGSTQRMTNDFLTPLSSIAPTQEGSSSNTGSEVAKSYLNNTGCEQMQQVPSNVETSWFPSAMEHTARARAGRRTSRYRALPSQSSAIRINNTHKTRQMYKETQSGQSNMSEHLSNPSSDHFKPRRPRPSHAVTRNAQHQYPFRGQYQSSNHERTALQSFNRDLAPPLPRRSSRRTRAGGSPALHGTRCLK